MLEIHELLGRNLDSIDDVCHHFERYYTEDYFDPVNGDWISDDYFRIINLTTKPGSLTEEETGKLSRSITRLNGKYEHICRRLGVSSLIEAYNDTAKQINTINSADANRANIPTMQPAATQVAV